jgi:hypothetical protein
MYSSITFIEISISADFCIVLVWTKRRTENTDQKKSKKNLFCVSILSPVCILKIDKDESFHFYIIKQAKQNHSSINRLFHFLVLSRPVVRPICRQLCQPTLGSANIGERPSRTTRPHHKIRRKEETGKISASYQPHVIPNILEKYKRYTSFARCLIIPN